MTPLKTKVKAHFMNMFDIDMDTLTRVQSEGWVLVDIMPGSKVFKTMYTFKKIYDPT